MHIWFCIFVHILCIFMHMVFLHICAYFVFAYFSIFMLIMHIYCIFLVCLFVHIPAYFVLHIAAYFVHISAYLNMHIMAYLPSCIFKHITHISAYKMHIYAYFRLIVHIYCIFLICIFVHISCIFGTAYFVHISAYFNLHIMAYLPLCIFKLISAYLHLLCLPRPISLIKIQTAAGAQRKRCFFRRPNFLSFNRPHTRLKITGGSGGGGACRAAGRPGRRPAQAAPLPRGRQTRANPHELASNEESTRICCGRACWNGTGTASNPASWNGSGRNIHKYAKKHAVMCKTMLKICKICRKYA